MSKTACHQKNVSCLGDPYPKLAQIFGLVLGFFLFLAINYHNFKNHASPQEAHHEGKVSCLAWGCTEEKLLPSQSYSLGAAGW